MRIAASIFAIYVIAVLLALFGTPEGDPYSFIVGQIALSLFGFCAFALGWWAKTSTASA
jgi:hypothetical protein